MEKEGAAGEGNQDENTQEGDNTASKSQDAGEMEVRSLDYGSVIKLRVRKYIAVTWFRRQLSLKLCIHPILSPLEGDFVLSIILFRSGR